jgi:hypothetical protein
MKSETRPYGKNHRKTRDNKPKERIHRDFQVRTQKEKETFTKISWCNSCQASNLGMFNPVEFELNGRIFVEGDCPNCNGRIISEIIHQKDERFDEDIIAPIYDQSVKSQNELRQSPYASLLPWLFIGSGDNRLGNSPRKSLWYKIFVILFMIAFVFLLFKVSENPSIFWR